jgi:hypothetical protein
MKKIIIAIAVVIAAIVIFFANMKGPDFSAVMPLVEPRITDMPDQKMIVVEVQGNPNEVGGKAFGLLFKAYYKVKEAPKGRRQPAPRARWPKDLDTPMSGWLGRYALPVPETVSALPEMKVDSGLKIGLVTWQYGKVAEILHVGPYGEETVTIEKLLKFIADSGHKTAGEHEEEYLKGPGMIFRGDPEKYLTIIRYPVVPRE